MSFTLPQTAERDTLYQSISYFLQNSYMRLLASAIPAGPATTLPNCLAVEATFVGYSQQPLNSWGGITFDVSGSAIATVTAFFTPTSGSGTGNVYGYFICDATATFFYGLEVFSSGSVSTPNGVQLAIAFTYSDLTRF